MKSFLFCMALLLVIPASASAQRYDRDDGMRRGDDRDRNQYREQYRERGDYRDNRYRDRSRGDYYRDRDAYPSDGYVRRRDCVGVGGVLTVCN